jgi:alpha-1,6-mannosyltransferase
MLSALSSKRLPARGRNRNRAIRPDLDRSMKSAPSTALVAATLTAAGLVGLRALAPDFTIDRPPEEQPVAAAFALAALAGLAFAAMAAALARKPIAGRSLTALLALGFLLRALFFGSQPILEDDWRRYLWEGAAVAAGVSPYSHPPAEGFLFDAFGERKGPSESEAVETLRRIGAGHDAYPELVNHPYLTSVYPPPAQAAFAVAHVIAPFSLDAWRFVLLLVEAGTLLLLLRALAAFALPPSFSLLYWLNPLVIAQTFSGAHMDALIAGPLIAAFLAARAGRPAFAGGALGLAVGVKIWPLLLAPIIFRRFLRAPRALALAAGAAGLTSLILLAPLLLAASATDSGLFAYATEWQRGAFLFVLMEKAAAIVGVDGGAAARLAAATLCGGAALLLGRTPDDEGRRAPARALTLVMILLALSPTAYPWYAVWAAALLPLSPSLGAALLAAGGAVYMLRFPNSLTGTAPPFLLLGAQIALPLAIHLLMRRREGA